MEEQREIDLFELLGTLWKRAWIIVLCTVLAAIMAFGVTLFWITPKYQAEVLIYVNNSSASNGSSDIIDSGEITAAKSLVDVYVIISKMRSTLETVIAKTGVDLKYEELSDMISATAVDDTEIFKITVTDADPHRAVLIANTLADVLPEKIASIVDGSSVRIMDYATPPSARSSPSYSKNVLIGAMLGFLLCSGVIVLIEILDDKIKNANMLVQRYEFPLLAEIPDLYAKKHSSYKYKYYGSTRATAYSEKGAQQ